MTNPTPTRYVVTFAQKDINAFDDCVGDLDGKTIALHIRNELRASGGGYQLGNWEFYLLNSVNVKPIVDRFPTGPESALTANQHSQIKAVIKGLEPMNANTTIQQAIEVLNQCIQSS